MMVATSSFKAAMALAAALLLAACATEPAGPASGEAGAISGTALPPPAVGETHGTGDLSTTRVEPVEVPGAADGASGSQAAAAPVVIEGPDGTSWTVDSPKDEEAYRADVEDCYRYALGQTRRDAQMLDDRNAAIDTLTNDSRYAGLRQRVDEFDLRNRRTSLMESCMESKGYARADPVLPRLDF